jgi:hypothetical protein
VFYLLIQSLLSQTGTSTKDIKKPRKQTDVKLKKKIKEKKEIKIKISDTRTHAF